MGIDSTPELSGLDFLQRYTRWDSLQAADRATWDKWVEHEHAELWVVMALHVGLDPDSLEACGESAIRTIDSYRCENEADLSMPFDQYLAALDLAVRASRSREVQVLAEAEDPRRSVVRFDAVIDWANSNVSPINGWPPADVWPDMRAARPGEPGQSTARASAARCGDTDARPSGSLQQMLDYAIAYRAEAAARGKFVTNEVLEAILKAQFPDSSVGAREVIATDTRLKDQKKGRPPKT